MRKGQVEKRKCLNCGLWLIPVKDPIKKTYTGHLYKCKCSANLISIG